MGYSISDLDHEIERKVARRKVLFPKSWLVKAILSDHDVSGAKDFAFADLGVKRLVAQQVDRLFREENTSKNDTQMVLPGCKYIQARYVFERLAAGEKMESYIGTPHEMTAEELQKKADQHRAWSKGHAAHADELEAFIAARQSGKLANR